MKYSPTEQGRCRGLAGSQLQLWPCCACTKRQEEWTELSHPQPGQPLEAGLEAAWAHCRAQRAVPEGKEHRSAHPGEWRFPFTEPWHCWKPSTAKQELFFGLQREFGTGCDFGTANSKTSSSISGGTRNCSFQSWCSGCCSRASNSSPENPITHLCVAKPISSASFHRNTALAEQYWQLGLVSGHYLQVGCF